MTKPYLLLNLLLIASVVLSGCATKPDTYSIENIQELTPEQRVKQLQKNKKWQLQGKIAFIQKIKSKNGSKEKDKRESASISWHVNADKETQTLNLTSYLGINVLQLKSSKNQHIITIDGKKYHGTNLAQLIYSLTELTLPAKALLFWLKGLPYEARDELKVNPQTHLPISISSYYNNSLWQINYSNYQIFDGIEMATQFTIKKDDLLIKLAVSKWSLNN